MRGPILIGSGLRISKPETKRFKTHQILWFCEPVMHPHPPSPPESVVLWARKAEILFGVPRSDFPKPVIEKLNKQNR